MISTDLIMPQNHIYRKILPLINIKELSKFIKNKNPFVGPNGFGNKRLIFINVLQYLENLSDRDMEKEIQENITKKWFCGFSLSEKTPTYSTFCKFRTDIIGDDNINLFYQEIKRQIGTSLTLTEIKKNFKIIKK